jgi:DNA-binding response OmpR family regulator
VKVRSTVIRLGDVEIQVSSRRVLREGQEVLLRPKEADLLFALIERAGDVVPRDNLLRDVWGYAPGVGSRTVDWHVAELRRKLGDDARDSRLIETIKKVGYRVPLYEPSRDES